MPLHCFLKFAGTPGNYSETIECIDLPEQVSVLRSLFIHLEKDFFCIRPGEERFFLDERGSRVFTLTIYFGEKPAVEILAGGITKPLVTNQRLLEVLPCLVIITQLAMHHAETTQTCCLRMGMFLHTSDPELLIKDVNRFLVVAEEQVTCGTVEYVVQRWDVVRPFSHHVKISQRFFSRTSLQQ